MKIRSVGAELFHADRQTDELVPCTMETLVTNLLFKSYFLFGLPDVYCVSNHFSVGFITLN